MNFFPMFRFFVKNLLNESAMFFDNSSNRFHSLKRKMKIDFVSSTTLLFQNNCSTIAKPIRSYCPEVEVCRDVSIIVDWDRRCFARFGYFAKRRFSFVFRIELNEKNGKPNRIDLKIQRSYCWCSHGFVFERFDIYYVMLRTYFDPIWNWCRKQSDWENSSAF